MLQCKVIRGSSSYPDILQGDINIWLEESHLEYSNIKAINQTANDYYITIIIFYEP
jgi:hypothetical protein